MKNMLFLGLLLASTQSVAEPIDTAISYFDSKQDDQAMAILQSIDSADSAVYQAQILMEQDLDDAEEFIEQAVTNYPESAALQYWRGRIMGSQAGNAIFSALSYADKSLTSFNKAVEMEPDNVEFNTGLMMFHLNAPSIAGGDEEIAIAMVEKIQKLDAEQGLSAQFRIISRTSKKDTEAQLLSLLDANPDVAILQFEMAQWYQRQENYNAAFSHYDAALAMLATEANDEVCSIWYQYGKTAGLAEQNKVQGIAYLDKYLKQCQFKRNMPSEEWATFRRANIIELDSKQEAISIYRSLKSSGDKDLIKALKKKKV